MLKTSTCFAVTALLVQILIVQCCEKSTFRDAKIKASKYFHLVDDPDDIKLEDTLTGCITPSEELKDAVQIIVKNQDVPTLYEGAVQDMEWLHVLTMEENGIEAIEAGAFANLPTISTISLAKNRIKAIPEGVFNNMEVRRIFLNDNSISSIAPGAFDDMPNLSRIDLDHNKLQQWNSKWFTNTPNIYFLSATFNQLDYLPVNAFKNFKGQHERPGKSPLVTSMYFSNNKIGDIHPFAFRGLKQLEFLDLDENDLVEIDANVFGNFENIKNLMLSGNKIKCLDEDFLRRLPNTELTSIEENPLDCKCLKDMQEWARKNNVNIKMNIRKVECMQERIKNVLDSVNEAKDATFITKDVEVMKDFENIK